MLNESERPILELLKKGARLSLNEIAESIYQNISITNVLMIQIELKHYVKKAIDGKYEAQLNANTLYGKRLLKNEMYIEKDGDRFP